jgi:hypothetical protein
VAIFVLLPDARDNALRVLDTDSNSSSIEALSSNLTEAASGLRGVPLSGP